MDEYEKLERELERQYETYLERYRNLDFLEHEMDLYRQAEQERLKESNRRLNSMQAHLRQEELNALRQDPDAKPLTDAPGRRRDDGVGDDGLDMKRPGAANSVRRDKGQNERSNGNRVIGSMDQAGNDSSDSSDGGSDVSDVSGESSRSSKFSDEDEVSMGGSNSVSGSSEDGSIDEDGSDVSEDDDDQSDDTEDF